MGRILAIDYGLKRTGIAVTDTLQLIANGMDTVPTAGLFEFLSGYFVKEPVDTVVIGYPLQMNNQPSEIVPHIDRFIVKFLKTFPGKDLVKFDERFTSKMAFQAMIDAGATRTQRKNKALIDKVSATIILQSYLESKSKNSQG